MACGASSVLIICFKVLLVSFRGAANKLQILTERPPHGKRGKMSGRRSRGKMQEAPKERKKVASGKRRSVSGGARPLGQVREKMWASLRDARTSAALTVLPAYLWRLTSGRAFGLPLATFFRRSAARRMVPA